MLFNQNNGEQISLHEGLQIAIDLCLERIRENFQETPIPYFVSSPGAGKTQVSKEITNQNGCGFMSITMGLKTYDEVSCLPYIHSNLDIKTNVAKPSVEWIKAEFIDQIWKESLNHKELIVLLDDYHLCSSEMQKIGNELFTYHALHGHKLPQNCAFFAAGNESTKSGANVILSSIISRMLPFKVFPDKNYWIENFAQEKGLNSTVLAFLSREINTPYFFEPESNNPTGSPRTWSHLAHTIDVLSRRIDFRTNFNVLNLMVSGCVSKSATKEFMDFYTIYSKVPVEDIFKSGEFLYPSEVAKYAFIIAITDYLISKIISYCEKTKFDSKNYPDETNQLKNYFTVYSKIIETYNKHSQSELSNLSLINLFKNKYIFNKNEKSFTMAEILFRFSKVNFIPPHLFANISNANKMKNDYVENLSNELKKNK